MTERTRQNREVKKIITNYGYADGSGQYYISVDALKCDACGKCIEACPQNALIMVTQFIDLEDKQVVGVAEEYRKKIKYTCGPCKPESGKTPCSTACPVAAISPTWTQR
jgi:ferredoxin